MSSSSDQKASPELIESLTKAYDLFKDIPAAKKKDAGELKKKLVKVTVRECVPTILMVLTALLCRKKC
jgi:hypothetical protein